jgi:mannose-1-phosphate guanylyltransferase
MVPLAGRPLLGHWFEHLLGTQHGQRPIIDRVLVNLHYMSDVVINYIKQSEWVAHVDTVFEDKLLGTCGTLRKNFDYFNDAPLFLAHADNASRFGLDQFHRKFLNRPIYCIGTMMTFNTENPSSCGIVEVNGDDVLIAYYEKQLNPPGRQANAAVFFFDHRIRSVLDECPDATDLCGEIVPMLIGRLSTFHNDVYHRDIGTPQSYQLAVKDYSK